MSKHVNFAKAPAINAVDVLGKRFKLVESKDEYALIVFLRYSGCPWCNLTIHRLALEYPRLREYNCQVVAIVQSDKDNVMENIYKRHEMKPQFPIIADKAMDIYREYNVNPSVSGTLKTLLKAPYWVQSVRKYGFKQKKIDGNFFIVPAWFLVHIPSGKILKSERGVSFYNHESFVQIYDSLIFKDS